ncbi:MAG TPA: hypothetical protein VFU05_14410 [Cyclobacteriaceae bacterium]|nr:hypothetical protein [Cyclobacteriaceae bacterium]
MKPFLSKFRVYLLVVLLGCVFLFESCHDQCEDRYTYSYYEPVYTPLSVIRSSIAVDEPRQITGVGKIYFKDGYLFVNEPGEGIHVIDNHDPANPLRKHFITIPGNYDMAIRNNILYADSYIDLVGLDISNPDQVVEVSRLENIFSQYNSMGFYVDAQRGLVTEWAEKKNVEIEESPCDADMQPWGGYYYRGGIVMWAEGDMSTFKGATLSNNSTGVGGSMAKFTISDDHLYMLDSWMLHAADISNPAEVIKKSTTQISWDIETIFPLEDKLFIGSQSGMHIFSLADPANPKKVSTYEHVRSCDPVVVEGETAYVTLRSGTQCQGFTNQLEVIDVSNWENPALMKVYPMHNPHGLGIDESLLFVCDGDAGLKIYDATDKYNIDQHLIKHYDNIHAFDVIPFNNVLMLIGEDGIYQYDYSDPTKIKLLSKLSIKSAQ